MSTLVNDAMTGPEPRVGGGLARLRLAAPLAVAVLVAGCVVGPKYIRPSVPEPPAYKEATPATAAWEQSAFRPARPADALVRGQWWTIFQDPELNRLESAATRSNQSIAAAAANFLAARAMVREAASQYQPVVAVDPSILNTRPSPAQFGGLRVGAASTSSVTVKSYTNYSVPFDASWEPDFWGRIRNGVRANAFAAQASAADLQSVVLSTEAEVAADYYELRAQDSLKVVLDATVAADRDLVDLTTNLYKAGLDADEVVAQAEAQLKAAQAQDAGLGILRAQYEHAVAVLLGQPPATFSLPPAPLEATVPAVPVGVPSDLLQRRPDVAEAERAVVQANSAIGVARAAYFPSILLSATGGFGNSSIADWLTWPSRLWSIGPSAVATIFDGGLRKATVARSRAVYDQTVANYRQTVLTAFQQVEDDLVALRLLADEIVLQDAAVSAAQRSLDEATVRFKSGVDPYLNVISAQTIVLNDRVVAVNLRMQAMVADVQLIKALGGGWNVSQLPTTDAVGRPVAPDRKPRPR
jgi:NodT family efflux transporter outer membrane factor (OMF) lipoprotein